MNKIINFLFYAGTDFRELLSYEFLKTFANILGQNLQKSRKVCTHKVHTIDSINIEKLNFYDWLNKYIK